MHFDKAYREWADADDARSVVGQYGTMLDRERCLLGLGLFGGGRPRAAAGCGGGDRPLRRWTVVAEAAELWGRGGGVAAAPPAVGRNPGRESRLRSRGPSMVHRSSHLNSGRCRRIETART
jgi:hypothetical protein